MRVLFALLAVTLVALEAMSALLAYETIGAVTSTLYWLAIGINVVFFVLAMRKPMLAATGMVLLALVMVPYQVTLAQRLWRVQSEATQIAGWSYEQKLANGDFPATLAAYRYRDPDTRTYIQEFRPDTAAGGFVVCYYVGSASTSHCYSPKNGWTYYPD